MKAKINQMLEAMTHSHSQREAFVQLTSKQKVPTFLTQLRAMVSSSSSPLSSTQPPPYIYTDWDSITHLGWHSVASRNLSPLIYEVSTGIC